MSTMIVPNSMVAQVDRAKLKADLNAKAAEAINNAGLGLVAADEQCRANASNGHTQYVLVIVQSYINDALAALIELQNLGVEAV